MPLPVIIQNLKPRSQGRGHHGEEPFRQGKGKKVNLSLELYFLFFLKSQREREILVLRARGKKKLENEGLGRGGVWEGKQTGKGIWVAAQ